MFFAKLVVIQKINEPNSNFIAMAQIKYFTKVVQVTILSRKVYNFIIAQPVFISQHYTAAQAKIPCKKSIQIKDIEIFILPIYKSSWQQIAFCIYIMKTYIVNFIPVMSCTQV